MPSSLHTLVAPTRPRSLLTWRLKVSKIIGVVFIFRITFTLFVLFLFAKNFLNPKISLPEIKSKKKIEKVHKKIKPLINIFKLKKIVKSIVASNLDPKTKLNFNYEIVPEKIEVRGWQE